MRRVLWILVAAGVMVFGSVVSAQAKDAAAQQQQPPPPGTTGAAPTMYPSYGSGAAAPTTGAPTGTAPATPAAPTATAPGSERLPGRFVLRPLTLPAMTAGLDGALSVAHVPEIDPTFGITLGGAFGITDDLEIEATVVPVVLVPEATVGPGGVSGDTSYSLQYQNPEVSGTYRFLRGNLEMGARLGLTVPLRNWTDDEPPTFAFSVALPVLVHIADFGRLDAALVYVGSLAESTSMGGDSSTELGHGLGLELAYYHQLTDALFAGLATGLLWPDVEEKFGDTMVVPLGLAAGYTLAGVQGPLADIGLSFAWPFFLTPGAEGDQVQEDLWGLGIFGRAYLYL